MGQWTAEQEAAISARGVSIIVSAAAGSGKTSVLVERLIRLLADTENRMSVEELAVVTFTKDAAAEMKQRLTSALSALIESDPDNQWLCRQQMLLQNARISTIHSFCFDLIRDNIQQLDISSGFRIIEETEERLINSKAVSDVLEAWYEDYPDEVRYLYDCFCHKNDSELEKILLTLHGFMCSIPFGQRWLKKTVASFECDKFEKIALFKSYMDYLSARAGRACTFASKALEICEKTGKVKQTELLEGEYLAIKKIYDILKSNDKSVGEKAIMLEAPVFGTLSFGKKGGEFAEEIERIQAYREKYKKICAEFSGRSFDLLRNFESDIKVHRKASDILCRMTEALNEQINAAKTEKNCIGFSDAERLAVELLAEVDENGEIHKTELARELSEYYKIIMIDEFQDTNNNQNLIFRLLSHNGTADRNGDNLFVVGDVKQAIYRFRQANPANFIETMEQSVEYEGEATRENACIRLNRNFRSSKEVISFVNYVFSLIMSERTGEINYNENEMLIQGASFADTVKTPTIALIEAESDNSINYEAVYTARKIAQMLDEKYPVCNRDGKTVRPCTKRDFCILMRGNKNAAVFKNELAKLGISAFSEEEKGYLKSREISVLMNLLRVVDNPLLDTAIASVMLSPMFMLDADELTRIRLVNPKGHLYDALCRAVGESYEETDEGFVKTEPMIDGALFEKAKYVFTTINELRMYSACSGPEEIIRRIYDSIDFMSVMQIYKDSEKKKANLRALLEYARIYEEGSNQGVSGFVRFIDRIMETKGDFSGGATVASSEDAVSIKTMHKSKGLEFPFVFIVGTHTRFNRQDELGKLQLNYEYGIGFRLQDRRSCEKFVTLPFEAINRMNITNSVSEEMRLLYVAMTRAKDRLFITMNISKTDKKLIAEYAESIKSSGTITPELAGSVKAMNGWLLMCLCMHKDGGVLREIGGVYDTFNSDGDFNIEFEHYTAEDGDFKLEGKQPHNESASPDPSVTSELKRRFAFAYDYRLSSLQAKVSVSDIAKADEDFEAALKKPKFLENKRRLSGAEKGTALHTFMQYASLKKLESDISGEIKRLIAAGVLTQEQAESIDMGKVNAFINSRLYGRILNAQKVLREKKFMVRIADLGSSDDFISQYADTDTMLQGVADMVIEEPDGLVLIDYKTDYTESADKLIEEYSKQLYLYRLALELIEGKPVKHSMIYSFSLGHEVEVTFGK